MAIHTFDEIVAAAEQLTPAEQAALIARLQVRQARQAQGSLLRERILAEHAARQAAGAFEHPVQLENRYATAIDVSDAELRQTIRESATAWQRDGDSE